MRNWFGRFSRDCAAGGGCLFSYRPSRFSGRVWTITLNISADTAEPHWWLCFAAPALSGSVLVTPIASGFLLPCFLDTVANPKFHRAVFGFMIGSCSQ